MANPATALITPIAAYTSPAWSSCPSRAVSAAMPAWQAPNIAPCSAGAVSRAGTHRGMGGPGPGRAGLFPHGCGQAGRGVQGEGAAADRHQHRRGAHGVGRMGEYRGQADEGRAEDEGQFVQAALEGERYADRLLGGARAAGEGDQAGARQRADERHGGPRGGAQEGQGGRRQPGERAGDERGHGEGVGEREGEHHRPLAVPVREPPHQRPAHHLSERERAAGQTGRAEGAARAGDEQHAAELDGGRRQPPQERHARQQRPGQADHLPVGVPRARPARLPRRPHRSNVDTRVRSGQVWMTRKTVSGVRRFP
ncbi:hypothetical protein GCM10017687_32130 [Streptomyces echinatus]